MEGGKGKSVVLIGCFCLVFSGSGCGVKLVPFPSPEREANAGGGWAKIEAQDIGFTAREGKLKNCPSYWDRQLIPFAVKIENRKGEAVSVRPGDFILRDENDRQYQPIDPIPQAA